MSGSADDDSISTSQNGTASTALTINGNSSVPLDADGLVSNGSTSGSGTLSINGDLSSEASSGINSFINVASSSNNSSVTFTINGTNIDGSSLTETVTGVNNNTVSTTNIFATVTSITTNATSSAINIGNSPAIVSSSGQRASVTSSGGDESSNSFTIIGTDLSGNSQTEVVTGPAANATAFGSKTFKTITSITPTSNTNSSIKIGTTSNGITTAGVTGSATFQSITMSADPDNKTFTITSGDGAGIKVKYSGLGSDATVYFGQSMIEKISAYLTDILDSSTGLIATREKTISSEMTEQNALLLDLKTQMESTRARYIQQFTVMEQSVTSLKSTGEYLTNLFEAMNKDN
jgi:flagellar hook-associated protein 2